MTKRKQIEAVDLGDGKWGCPFNCGKVTTRPGPMEAHARQWCKLNPAATGNTRTRKRRTEPGVEIQAVPEPLPDEVDPDSTLNITVTPTSELTELPADAASLEKTAEPSEIAEPPADIPELDDGALTALDEAAAKMISPLIDQLNEQSNKVTALMEHIEAQAAKYAELDALYKGMVEQIPAMVNNAAQNMAGNIAAGVKQEVGNGGGLGGVLSGRNLMELFEKVNVLIETPTGGKIYELLERWIGKKSAAKGATRPISEKALNHGMSQANRLLFNKKLDAGATAKAILESCDFELKSKALAPDARDMLIGMKSAAQIALDSNKPAPITSPPQQIAEPKGGPNDDQSPGQADNPMATRKTG